MIPEDGKPMRLDGRSSLWDRTREFLVFLATVVAVLAGAEAVMLLRGGDVEAGQQQAAAAATGPAVRSADEATLAGGRAPSYAKPSHQGAAAKAPQKDQ